MRSKIVLSSFAALVACSPAMTTAPPPEAAPPPTARCDAMAAVAGEQAAGQRFDREEDWDDDCADSTRAIRVQEAAIRCYRAVGDAAATDSAIERLEDLADARSEVCEPLEVGGDDCESSDDCLELGMCSSVEGACRAGSSDDCRDSTVCGRFGWCSPVDGMCLAASDADCRGSGFACGYRGLCEADGYRCVAGSDDPCRAARSCAEDGACVAREGRCVAAHDADCAQAQACRRSGACGAGDGECRPTTKAHCEASEACTRFGRCSLVEGACRPASNADCGHGAETCGRFGRCTYSAAERGCFAGSAADCSRSLECRENGYCEFVAPSADQPDDEDEDATASCRLTMEGCRASTRCWVDPPRWRARGRAPRPGPDDGGGILILGKRYPLRSGVKVVTFADDPAWDVGAAPRPELEDDEDFETPSAAGRPRRGNPRSVRALRRTVNLIMLHTDLTWGAGATFRTLTSRGLSTHFIIDWDGTVYQLVDVAQRAAHVAEFNNVSVGIDLNNPMQNMRGHRLSDAYARYTFLARLQAHMSEHGYTRPLSPPTRIQHGLIQAHGYTDAQYASLVALLRVLTRVLAVRPEPPMDRQQNVFRHALEGHLGKWLETGGIVAHWHTSSSRWDPGPGFDWQRMIRGLAADE